jgi:hypothetical protein
MTKILLTEGVSFVLIRTVYWAMDGQGGSPTGSGAGLCPRLHHR